MSKQPKPDWQWSAKELEEGKVAWDTIVEILNETGSKITLAKLDHMILERGAEHVIAETVDKASLPEEVKESYRKAVRFRAYDFNNPEIVDRSRPGVTECFVAPKPTTKPW